MERTNYLLILFGMLAISIISCKDDEEKERKANIIGTWEIDMIQTHGCKDAKTNGLDTVSCSDSFCVGYTFNADRTFSSITTSEQGSFEETGTYSISNNTLSFCVEGDAEDDPPICTPKKFNVSSTIFRLTESADEKTGCRTEYIFSKVKQEEEENEGEEENEEG